MLRFPTQSSRIRGRLAVIFRDQERNGTQHVFKYRHVVLEVTGVLHADLRKAASSDDHNPLKDAASTWAAALMIA